MSPEIRVNGQLIADVPDKTGGTRLYKTLDGKQVMVNLDGIEARNRQQIVEVQLLGPSGEYNGPLRRAGLTHEGVGSTSKTKRGGDGEEPVIDVVLKNRPIRATYRMGVRGESARPYDGPNGGGYVDKRTYHNPYWMRK